MIKFHNIIKSQQDFREYRGLHLENGMKVLLVSDPTTDLSAAAMSVEVGFMSDPDNLPGLAHFCEHMLFLGTEKYPNENEYSAYLTQNGGSSNAATFPHMTNYYFNVAPDKLDGALDRFSQFFISPLFTESATDREINAVNSEHENNLSSDAFRIHQLEKHLADPKHPYSKFGAGNKYTLEESPKKQGINVRDKLIEFHKKWYSSNIMCLAILGKESLNNLEEMVVKKFSQVENKKVTLPSWPKKPYKEEDYGTKVLITPVKDVRSLRMSFTTEDLDEFYKSRPARYISRLIGHEGNGSILSALRRKGWCNHLSARHENTSRGFGFYEIGADLTKDGLEHVDEIVGLIYQYIKLLREEGPKKWIFEEYCNLSEMRFRFKDKETPINLVTSVVQSMQLYPLNEVLAAPYLASEWRPDLITNLLDKLKPKNCRIIIVAQNLDLLTPEFEPWYKTKYSKQKIPSNVIESWENCMSNEKLKLPLPNPFIPTDFSLLPLDSNAPKHPVIIFDSPIMRVWHKQDAEFLKPRTCMDFDFSNPIVYTDPLNCNLTAMLVGLFKDQLKEYLHEAGLAGLTFEVVSTTSGISVEITGYSHKQQILLEEVLNHLFDFKIDEQRFNILKDEYMRKLSNFKAKQPYEHAIYYLNLILTENHWSNIELLEAMQLVTLERLQHFMNEFFSRLHTECFIYGNVNKLKALQISEIVKKKLETTNSVILPLLSRQLLQRREYKLGDGERYIFETNNDYHKSSCAELYLQCEMQTDTSAVFTDFIVQILEEPCYNSLRTKEQLGYIVFCESRNVNGTTGIMITVQSTKHPSYVEDRIENFLNSMMSEIESMSSEDFQIHKDALITRMLKKPKKLIRKFYEYLSEISGAQYHFERAEAEVNILNNITQEQLLNYYKTYIMKNGSARHALSVYIISNLEGSAKKSNAICSCNKIELPSQPILQDDCIKIMDLSSFKSSKELYPVPRPFLDIRPKGASSKL